MEFSKINLDFSKICYYLCSMNVKEQYNEREILMVQMIANDCPREEMAKRFGVEYKALSARINKLRKEVGVQSDAALAIHFFKLNLID